MADGVVKRFTTEKGFGFLAQDDGGPDVFAHYSAIAGRGYKELRDGEHVTLDIEQSAKGPQATNVIRD